MKISEASALHQRGELERARILYEQILEMAPEHFDALHLSGVIAAQTKNPQKAADLIAKAIKINPSHPAAHCNLATALQELRQLDAAVGSYDRAIALKPDYAAAYSNRGNVLRDLQRFDAALLSYDRAIAIRPDFADAHFNRANLLNQLRQFDAALAGYDRAIATKANWAEAYFKRGNVLVELRRLDGALSSYDQAVALKADYAEALFNRGNVLKELHEFEAAVASYDRAIAITPGYAEAHVNRGFVLKELLRLDEALASYDRAVALKPDFAEAHFNKSTALLLTGQFEQGWREYQWRLGSGRGTNAGARDFVQPLWHGGAPIVDETLLIYSEQGLGDTLQFCRYARRVASLGARVILEVQESLAGLLGSLEGVSQVVPKGAPLPDFDRHCPLMSLPLAFGTRLKTIPGDSPYLSCDPAAIARWRRRLGADIRPRIGLAWSGNSAHVNDHRRSIALHDVLAQLPRDFQYVSLQTEVREADLEALEHHDGILHFADELRDFGETAALCECLDLVISVDTSAAHLSGALGKRTWLLLPVNPDWRWLLSRDDSPWYPSLRLYRQSGADDWQGVLERVAADLIRSFPRS
jgi:tetratricopeptide (TPR) repeat protein